MKNYIFPLGFLEKIQFLIKFYRVAKKHKKDRTIRFNSIPFFFYKLYQFLLWQLIPNVQMPLIKKINIWKDSLLLYAFIPADHMIHDGQILWNQKTVQKLRLMLQQNLCGQPGSLRLLSLATCSCSKRVSLFQCIIWFTSEDCLISWPNKARKGIKN